MLVFDINKYLKENTGMYIEGDVPVVTTGNNNGNNGWNDWSWIIGLAVVGGIFGNGGFGFGGNNRGFGGIAENYALATDFATLERKLDGVNNGLCDGFYAQNTNMLNGFAAVQQTLCQGFSGVNATINNGFANTNNAICTLGYQNQAGFNALSRELADCCCATQRAIDGVKYENAKNTCDIIRAGQDNTRAILDYLTNEKIEGLRAENVALKGQISNDRQSRYIVDALSPKCPQPAYVVQPPQEVTFPTNCCGNVAYANFGNNGCGCC
jgi:hypothetical protein